MLVPNPDVLKSLAIASMAHATLALPDGPYHAGPDSNQGGFSAVWDRLRLEVVFRRPHRLYV